MDMVYMAQNKMWPKSSNPFKEDGILVRINPKS